MKMNLKVLGLGAILTCTLITPAFANQDANILKKVDTVKLKKEQKVLSVAEQIKNLEGVLQKIEKSYKDGKMKEETYTAKKENIKKMIEDIKSGKATIRFKSMNVLKKMAPEERIKKYEGWLQKLENTYKEGKIEKEKYTAQKEKITKIIEDLKNGKEPEQFKKVHTLKKLKKMTPEEMKKQYEGWLQELETLYKEGKIEKEKYTAKKENIIKTIENLKNGKALKQLVVNH
ncbi:hypothetical protein [Crassaminicella profunda]|uniref:hypothetical protein n=1 Tax=Crassaminicella profunda TaxID=1286698 RepID=UPI001CA6E25E|nr:hypothetical protein [Crassaminicella profunda]QZY55994.1 hypothetical protein K7H06_03045 [Crassaminicella profunda]